MTGGCNNYQLGTRNHLLLTPSLCIRAVLDPCAGRLGDHLRTSTRPFHIAKDAEILHLFGGGTERTAELRLVSNDIVLAHEYVDLSGDPHFRAVGSTEQRHAARIALRPWPGLFVEGLISGAALEWQRRYFSLQAPKITGTSAAVPVIHGIVNALPYLIVNREAVEAVFQVETPQ